VLKKVLAMLFNKVGGINLGLRIAEFILNNLNMSWKIPYSGYTNDLIEQIQKVAEDGKISSTELAQVIKYFRAGRE